MIISISGNAGSGKSTVAEKVVVKLNYESYYIGGIRREMARKRGMTLEEYNTYGETHPETDEEVEDYQTDLGKTKDNFVIQGRVSYHFIPQSIKVFLDVHIDEGTKRIWKDMQENPEERNEAKISSPEELKASLIKRQKSDILRYRKFYNLDPYNTENYDIVIDSTDMTPDQVVNTIITHPLVKQA